MSGPICVIPKRGVIGQPMRVAPDLALLGRSGADQVVESAAGYFLADDRTIWAVKEMKPGSTTNFGQGQALAIAPSLAQDHDGVGISGADQA